MGFRSFRLQENHVCRLDCHRRIVVFAILCSELANAFGCLSLAWFPLGYFPDYGECFIDLSFLTDEGDIDANLYPFAIDSMK